MQKPLLFVCLLALCNLTLLTVPIGHAQQPRAKMIRSDDLQQDKTKLDLCIYRARHRQPSAHYVMNIGDQDIVPFEIDAWYLAQRRKEDPNMTFFATGAGTLYECTNWGGLYGAYSASGESWFFHIFHPPSFQPPIGTIAGAQLAVSTCLKDVPQQTDLSGFDHASTYGAQDVGYISHKATARPTHPSIGGVPVASYDVEVNGVAFFKTSGIDLFTLDFTCLYSPMLKLKAVGWREKRAWIKSARQAAGQGHR